MNDKIFKKMNYKHKNHAGHNCRGTNIFSNIVELLLFLCYTSIIQLSIVPLSIYSTIFKTISFQNVSNVSNATKLHHESFMQSNTRSIHVTKRIKISGILPPHSN